MLPRIYLSLAIIFPLLSFAQPLVTEKSVQVRPLFKLGENKSYLVKVESKMDDPPAVYARSEENYRVSFAVLDTTEGYTIAYEIHTLNVTNKRWTLQTVKAQIVNGLRLVYKLDRQGKMLSYGNLRRFDVQLIDALDSITSANSYSSLDSSVIQEFRRELYTATGLEECLQPMLFFNSVFRSTPFRSPTDYTAEEKITMFGEAIGVPGVSATSVQKIDRDNDRARLSIQFKGNPDSAAKIVNPVFAESYKEISNKDYKGYVPSECRNDYERQYEIELSSGWPLRMTNRTILKYFIRTIYYTTMVAE